MMRLLFLCLVLCLAPACDEPPSCVELRQKFCERCGDDHPRCEEMQHRSDSAERCQDALSRFTKRMVEVEALEQDARSQKLEFLCREK